MYRTNACYKVAERHVLPKEQTPLLTGHPSRHARQERPRDANLDLLRALAIIAVVLYHIHGMWPTEYRHFAPVAHLGKYGVTLFFVLSGWLIGGIFFRDRDTQRPFSITSFWARRWLRTVPPYLVGVTFAYLAVLMWRNQQFEPKYLYFGQNYDTEIPFYLVSWSLCVEEHFYLILPLLGLFFLRLPKRLSALIFWVLPLLPPVFRLVDPNVEWPAPFGYSKTATHLVAEGLALGVASAFTSHYFPVQWGGTQKAARYLSLPVLFLFVSVAYWGPRMEFLVGQTVVSWCCFVWLAATAGQSVLPFATSKLVYAVAVSSYSVYLTHSLAIHIGLRIAPPSGDLPSELSCLAIWVMVIAGGGGAFYFSIERPSVMLRDVVLRKRGNNLASQGEPTISR